MQRTPTVTIARNTTKTDAGARWVGIEKEYTACLRRHLLATGRPVDGTLVFKDLEGRPLPRVAKAAEVEGIGFHVLRHSQGS